MELPEFEWAILNDTGKAHTAGADVSRLGWKHRGARAMLDYHELNAKRIRSIRARTERANTIRENKRRANEKRENEMRAKVLQRKVSAPL